MPPTDPILDELRAIRDAMAAEADFDPERLAESVRQREEASGRQFVTLPPRPVAKLNKKAS